MKPPSVLAYVTAICLIAMAMAALQDWSALANWSSVDIWGFATLIMLGLASEQQALSIKIGRVASVSSITFLPLLTGVLLFGPAAGVLFWMILGPLAEYGVRRKPALRANFNIGQYIASTAVAGVAYSIAGGEALMTGQAAAGSSAILDQIGPFMLYGVVFLVVNNASVSGAIAIDQGLSFQDTWKETVGRSGANLILDLLIGPIAIAVAALYMQIGAAGLLVAVLPLFFVRHSYQTTQSLQLANQDLLRALVKAIETRDPYTSGHSLRVSHLAKRIGQQLDLREAIVERVETAALLHDIGKIDPVYIDILRKPHALTPEERVIIESHVTRGEQLLRDLSSVPDDVIHAVRHHHEREDGTGYPDGLLGDEIPIGAKIIVVCDSVDAMLSDRPYRKALSLQIVREQLREHAGRQFDHRAVRALMDSDILDEYSEIMRISREVSEGEHEAAAAPPATPRRRAVRSRREVGHYL